MMPYYSTDEKFKPNEEHDWEWKGVWNPGANEMHEYVCWHCSQRIVLTICRANLRAKEHTESREEDQKLREEVERVKWSL